LTQRQGHRAASPGKGSAALQRLSARRERAPVDVGMVTAELAVAIPAVVLVLAICLAGVTAGVDQIRCVDAARVGARAAARGDSSAAVREAALAAGPAGARVTVVADGARATVTVEARSGGWGGVLPSWRLVADATAPLESSAGP
jgi:hypothetical protein